jgi:hypothetical protein
MKIGMTWEESRDRENPEMKMKKVRFVRVARCKRAGPRQPNAATKNKSKGKGQKA